MEWLVLLSHIFSNVIKSKILVMHFIQMLAMKNAISLGCLGYVRLTFCDLRQEIVRKFIHRHTWSMNRFTFAISLRSIRSIIMQ